MTSIDDAPDELASAIREFFPESEWDHAADIARLESAWRWDAELDTTSPEHPCGSVVEVRDGIAVTAERSIGYFQINACNFPDWNPCHFFNARQNVGTAHMLWEQAGSWSPWYFSAKRLGIL